MINLHKAFSAKLLFVSPDLVDHYTKDSNTFYCREQASSASGKAASSMSSDEKNQVSQLEFSTFAAENSLEFDVFVSYHLKWCMQKQISARTLMPPPRPSSKSFSHSANKKSRFGGSTSKKSSFRDMSTSSNTSDSINRSTFRKGRPADSLTGNNGSISSNSDARKPRRKRRPKKKKQQVVTFEWNATFP